MSADTYVRPAGVHPPLDYPEYRSSLLRAPKQPLVRLPHGPTETTGPRLGAERVTAADADLTTRHAGEPLGERIIVTGRVLDSDGRPVPDTLVEIWQANASGRYAHRVDDHPAPLDPNFDGAGRCMTDSQGRYRFVTIKPGAYPWRNHLNAWRPAHIHFSLFGIAFTQRLVTQMYFPGDPLFAQDPIFNSIPDPDARQRLISRFDLDTTEPDWALGFQWDIVLRGRDATAFESEEAR
jgi:protocatechuate 3,4-dioxygenase, beta subunit